MHVPYGFGVGDFVAVGTLAWNVYKSCKAAPASFDNISIEVLSLHAVLKECEETLFDRALQPTRAERLIVIKDGCDKVLVDLQSLVDKYESLGTQSKRTWDRMKWGNEEIAEIRARLISCTTMLNAFISTSQSNVESKLDKFIEEYHQGRREASIISLQTVDSLSADDKALWRTIRKELEEIGISVAAFDANRNFIFDWFSRAAETGAFEEQGERGIDDENDYSKEKASLSNNEQFNRVAGQVTRHTQSGSFTDLCEGPPAQPQLLAAATVAGPHSPRGPGMSGETVASNRAFNSTQVSRIGAFLAKITFPGPRLLRAIGTEDFPKALKILSDEASLKHLDPETLGQTLLSTTQLRGFGSSDHLSLISKLIARGTNVNYRSSGYLPTTPLENSVYKKSIAAVRLLLENGADVNDKIPILDAIGNYYQRDWFAPRMALTEDTEMLRLLLSAGADTSASYEISLTDPIHNVYFVWVTLLHEAARLEAIPAIEVLIEHGAEIDFLSPSYGTSLMVALLKGTEYTAKILLARGANPNINIDPESMIDPELPNTRRHEIFFKQVYKTPIEAAIVGGKLSMVKLLLKSGVLPSRSTLSFAEDARYRNRKYFDYHRSLDYPRNWDQRHRSGDQLSWHDRRNWNDHRSWKLVGNRIREDDEIVKVLEETLIHQND